jgi:hypothetical protein
MKITFKVCTTRTLGFNRVAANMAPGSQAKQVRHRGRAFGNGAQPATRRKYRDRPLIHTPDRRAQVQDPGREGLGGSSAETDLLG